MLGYSFEKTPDVVNDTTTPNLIENPERQPFHLQILSVNKEAELFVHSGSKRPNSKPVAEVKVSQTKGGRVDCYFRFKRAEWHSYI